MYWKRSVLIQPKMSQRLPAFGQNIGQDLANVGILAIHPRLPRRRFSGACVRTGSSRCRSSGPGPPRQQVRSKCKSCSGKGLAKCKQLLRSVSRHLRTIHRLPAISGISGKIWRKTTDSFEGDVYLQCLTSSSRGQTCMTS